jgi:hypothetical protein
MLTLKTIRTMKTTDQKLPYRISEYIKDHFREDFLFELKQSKQLKGRWYYIVEITKDNYIHTLRFDEDGNLIKDETDEAFPPDGHEDQGFGDIKE